MRKKILIAIFILFSLVFVTNTYQVSAKGIVTQGFIYNDNTNNISEALIFRTFTTPLITTVEDYHNNIKNTNYDVTGYNYTFGGNEYTSRWKTTLVAGNTEPQTYSFSTIRLAFHKTELGTYTDESNGVYGYNVATTKLDYSLATIGDAYDASYYQKTNVGSNNNYSSNVYYEIDRLKSIEEYDINYGTGLATSGFWTGKIAEYRYAIANIKGANVYVADNIIYKDDLKKIMEKNNYENTTYVSEILASKTDTNSKTEYQIAHTPANFYNKMTWSDRTRGLKEASKGMGSVINMYDNILEFPQISKRTVLVRHINIGKNTGISTRIIDNSSRIPWHDKNYSPYLWNSTTGEWKYDGRTYSSYYYGYEEYFEESLRINEGFSVYAYNVYEPIDSKYRCIGYNVATAENESVAKSNICAKIDNGSYVSGTAVNVAAKEFGDNSDVTVIDFYYTEYEKDVEVNHVIVDKNGVVKAIEKQQMPAGEEAYENDIGWIKRINTEATVKEVYQKRLGRSITVYKRPDKALGDNYNVKYYGYETFNTSKSLSDLVGTKININEKASGEYTISEDIKQVNFYYCIEQEIPYNEPEKDPEGTVFVAAIDTKNNKAYESLCADNEEKINITSIPTASYAKVGIEGLPRYMVGAIYTKYNPSEAPNTLKINVNLKYGNETKTVTYDGFKYKAGYYRVTDMAVYKLQDETIYDANNGANNTLGNKLFSWNSKTLNSSDISNMNLSASLSGIDGRTIRNISSDIENINNYVSVSIRDKYGYTSGSGATNTTYSKTFLTEKEIKEVDATNYDPITKKWDKSINQNEYAVINANDKTYADNKLNQYNTVLENAKLNTLNKETELQNAKDKLASLEKIYNDATNTLNTKQTTYDNELEILRSNKKAYDDEKLKLDNYDKDIEAKEKEVQEAEADIGTKNTLKTEAETVLANVEKEKTRLYNIYQAKVAERNTLQANANCTDTVEDEVYIYMEQEEKDNLEKCKEAKIKYQENLDNKVVENASEEYLTYLDGDYQSALDAVSNATEEYNNAVTNKNTLDEELSKMRLYRLGLETMVHTLQSTHDTHFRDVYTPAKNDLQSYKENEYKKAKEEYEEYRDGGYISAAQDALKTAESEQAVAQDNYDKYNSYRNTLYQKYDEYKAKYDEYVYLINSSSDIVASSLGLQVQIKVQNMSVTVKNGSTTQNLFKEGTDVNNSKTETISLSDYIATQKTVEVYTSRPEIDKELYSSIGGTSIKVEDYLTTNNSSYIASDRLNGVRVLSGEVTYKTEMLIGDTNNKSIKDNVYYSDLSTEDISYIFNLKIGKTLTETFKYKNSNDATEKYKNVKPINVYTPITAAAELTIDDSKVVDQSNSDTNDLSVIQLNTPFTLNLTNNQSEKVYSMSDTTKYRAGFYVKFGFDVHKVKINGKTYKSGSRIKAGTWIGIITNNSRGKAYIEAQPYANLSDNIIDALSEENNTYTVRAVAFNATKLMMDESIKYATLAEMTGNNSSIADRIFNICNNPSYFAQTEYDVVILNRVYDFRVTDLKDLDWKNIFRSKKSSTNAHTGAVYYSGTTKWNYKSDKSNSIISRTTSEIGRNPIRTLPLGPYKNTNTSYVKAPKMGYRFSFDFKVTGSYYKSDVTSNTQNVVDRIRTDKKVNIKTKFYYVSKDGKTYYPEYTGNGAGIYLFYKNSNGKYIRIDENGGGYELTFTPNDGYRLIEDIATETLATKKMSLGNLRNVTLTYQMATVADNHSAITYYGDYKLPNSTIAVFVNKDGTYDINKPLKAGYIGVVFDINVYSGTTKVDEVEKDVILSYDKDTKKSQNTSQWDYEGFLGYTKVGNTVKNGEVSIKLEKGKWQIDNDTYQDIKGTVILYDTDQRAATDYD